VPNGTSERRAHAALAAIFAAVVGLIAFASFGRGASPTGKTRESSRQAVPVTVEPVAYTVPANFWTDYVVVDAENGATLTVHSTRGPGHSHATYEVAAGQNTILEPDDPSQPFAPSPGVQVGMRFYFTGTVEAGSAPTPTRVEALRIFLLRVP
jgi:hypothetical protein